ncbi:hypothetical protein MPAR162_14060 [Methylorubrum populi]
MTVPSSLTPIAALLLATVVGAHLGALRCAASMAAADESESQVADAMPSPPICQAESRREVASSRSAALRATTT